MIDTDKYEGHTEGPWRIVCWERKWYIEGDYEEGQEDCTASDVCHLYGTAQRKDPTARLIADAPLLLEEVKRLRERHVAFMQWMIENHDEIVNEWEASELLTQTNTKDIQMVKHGSGKVGMEMFWLSLLMLMNNSSKMHHLSSPLTTSRFAG